MPCNQSAGPCWKPAVKARWQYQLQGSPGRQGGCRYAKTGFVNIGVTGTSFATGRTVAPTVFDIDILQDGKCYSPQDYSVLNYAAVQALHVRGAKVIGYIDAGTAETWRPDFPEMQAFDQSCDGCLFGNPLSNFPDEYWLNINSNAKGINPNTGQLETTRQFLLDEMLARVKEAKLIGVDAIEFDDVDGYQSRLGTVDQRGHAAAVQRGAGESRPPGGLSVGLKNDRDQAETLQPYFDFGIEEECWANAGVRSDPGLAEQVREGGVRRGVRVEAGRVLPEVQLAAVRLQLDRKDRRPVRSSVCAVSLIWPPVVSGSATPASPS